MLLVPCLRLRDMPPRKALPQAVANRYDAHLAHQDRIRGSGIYPAIQNINLACRALGLRTVDYNQHICTRARSGNPRLRQSLYLALMPMGYPVGKYGPLSRRPVSQVAFADRRGEPWTVHGSTER